MKINNLTKIYKTEYELVRALNDMTLTLPQKGMVFIVGVSGSGKTTLMNILSGVDKPTKGEVIVGDLNLFKENKKLLFGYRNSYVGLIFQDYNLIEDLNVYDNIRLPLEFLGIKDEGIIDSVLAKVDIADIKYAKVTEISAGQMQRVAIARALVKDSAMILADEPTGNLDSKNTKIVMDLLRDISKDRLVLVITHDEEAAQSYGDRIIEIEDGTVLSDELKTPAINEGGAEKEKATDFVVPKISFSEQLKFTKSYMRNNLARSIIVLLMLILIPVIGNILCGYAFFDITTSYRQYQEKYGSNYLQLARIKSGNEMYFTNENEFAVAEKYGEENFYQLYSAYVPLPFDKKEIEESDFYKPVITNIIVDAYERAEVLDGSYPASENVKDHATIAITDYVSASWNYYTDNDNESYLGDELDIGGVNYEIVGIIDTNYEDFLNKDLSDPMVMLSFKENLSVYNAVYTSYNDYVYINDNLKYFVEEASYKTTIPGETVMKEVNGNFLVRKSGWQSIPERVYGSYPSLGSAPRKYCLVSRNLWEDKMQYDQKRLKNQPAIGFVFHSTNRYSFSGYVAYVYDEMSLPLYGVDGEIILKDEDFASYQKRRSGCRLLLSRDCDFYDEVIKNNTLYMTIEVAVKDAEGKIVKENGKVKTEEEQKPFTYGVVNDSFRYAKATWDKAKSSKYIMLEFLITLVVLMIIFSYIIHSLTLSTEKKKIGIKYSFGISKWPIVVPYVLETLFYIVIGVVASLSIVKGIYPLFMKKVVYTSFDSFCEFSFYYISSLSLVSWDLLIYLLMGTSLLIMVLTIFKKSPIEIIKDL